jgi:ubiquinone/menaquinone biosynthesis C-methylase UbiE
MSTITSLDSSVYYKEKYWDSFPQAKRYIQTQATGYKTKDSLKDFKERFSHKPFRNGLFLNCGNGWLERWCIKNKIVKKATAFDCSQTLIDEAKRKKGKLPITYFTADANTIEFPENTYDLVVNSAALHHVQYLNRFCYQIARALTPDGIFFHYDYIGPHRNQYSAAHWSLINEINNSLPKKVRKEPLSYPHLPTMMVTDPSEAVHSELIITMLSRYFRTLERHDISGMIAYNLLSLNNKLRPGDQNKHIAKILDLDQKAFRENKIPPLFTYMLTQPNKKILENKKQVRFWQLAENLRERDAGIIEWTYSISEFWSLIQHSQKKKRIIRLCAYLFARTVSLIQLGTSVLIIP